MKERSLICSTDDVRAILAGPTTMRRLFFRLNGDRTVYGPGYPRGCAAWEGDDDGEWPLVMKLGSDTPFRAPHPLGAVGDRRWVREAFNWSAKDELVVGEFSKLCPERAGYRAQHCVYAADGVRNNPARPDWGACRWRSAAVMPRWASRLTVETVAATCERAADGWVWVATVQKVSQ